MPNTIYKSTDGSSICFKQIVTPDGKKLETYELIYKSDAGEWRDSDEAYKPDQFRSAAEKFGLANDIDFVDI